jgi:hypothetical protein
VDYIIAIFWQSGSQKHFLGKFFNRLLMTAAEISCWDLSHRREDMFLGKEKEIIFISVPKSPIQRGFVV